MLTARDELPQKVAGFRAGADDYLTKPFALAELEVRLDALIRRGKGDARVLTIGDLCFDLATQEVSRAGMKLQLYSGGKKLLEALMRASPAVVPRDRLESLLWGDDPPDGDMLRSHIYELRKSVDGPFALKLIHTVPKMGYRLASPERP
jgi:DNA-binding response OmpR family regulator